MPAPKNPIKAALRGDGPALIGLWLSLASSYSTEALAASGFDFLVVDGEHSPNDVPLVREQLAMIATGPAPAVARPPAGETRLIKQYLDAGAQTLIIPMVESAAQAEKLVRDVRFPPRGVRGVAGMTRASGFGRTPDYLRTADDEICLIVQIESRAGLENIEAIAAVDGVDALFIGPADLGASLGFLGRPDAPQVQEAIEDAIRRIAATGKAPAILMLDEARARRAVELGAKMVVVGLDVGLLVQGAAALLARWR